VSCTSRPSTRTLRRRAPRPAQDRLDPRGELAGRERLDHVVVGAELEPRDPVGLLVARREQDHGHPTADPPADLEAVDPRQSDVEHDERHRVTRKLSQRVLAAARPQHPESLPFQVRADERADVALILDDHDRARHAAQS
jgi:hypothetical protein